jgi:hypothetical protein
MAAAFGWGTLAASSLVIGALIALWFRISLRAIGLIMGFGLTGGWRKPRILWMWIAIALVSGLASLAGYGLFQNASPDIVAFVLTFAAGAILTMLADTMMPEAFEHGGKWVGVATTLGFAVAFTIHTPGLSHRTREEEGSGHVTRGSRAVVWLGHVHRGYDDPDRGASGRGRRTGGRV